MYDIYDLPKSIPLGRQGEQYARAVEIDCAKMLNDYPGARLTLMQRRTRGETARIVKADVSDAGVITWSPDVDAMAVAGLGAIEIVATVDDKVAKSVIAATAIAPSLTPPDTDTQSGWVKDVLDASDAAQGAMAAAQESAAAAAGSAAAAQSSANAAAGSENAASKSATGAAGSADAASKSAGDAAQSASDAAASAKAAAGSAADAAGVLDNVNASAEAAAGSARAAAESAKDASASKSGAAQSATGAAGSASAASKSASDAAKSAAVASGSAAAAAESKTGAESAASTAKSEAGKAAASATAADTSAQAAAGSAAAAAESAQGAANAAKVEAAKIIQDGEIARTSTWSSQKIVEQLYPEVTASGNPAVIENALEGYLISIKASWEPIQEGEGEPSPDNIRPIKGRERVEVTRCAENLIDISGIQEAKGCTVDGDVVNIIDTSGWGQSYIMFASKVPTGTYTMHLKVSAIKNGRVLLRGYDQAGNIYKDSLLGRMEGYDATYNAYYQATMLHQYAPVAQERKITITTTPNIAYFRVGLSGGLGSGETQVSISEIMLTMGADTYKKYAAYKGQKKALQMPTTIYGGEVDAEAGEGKKEWEYIASYAGESLPGEWISDRDVYMQGAQPTIGAQVAYKLATPESFAATGGGRINALAGTNTISTDADALTVGGVKPLRKPIDDTRVGTDNVWSAKHTADMLLPMQTVTGNPVAIETLEGYPLELSASWEPKQGGSGTPSPDNVRPITGGRDNVTVTRAEDGASRTVALGKMAYGGRIKFGTRAANVTYMLITINGTEKMHRYLNYFYIDGKYDAAVRDVGICSHYRYEQHAENSLAVTNAKDATIVYNGKNHYTADDAGLEAWRAYLSAQYAAGTPVQICYELATPQEIEVEGADNLLALAGTNTISTDADTVTITAPTPPQTTASAAEAQAAKLDYVAMMADVDVDDLTAVDDADADSGMMYMPTDIEGSETDGK